MSGLNGQHSGRAGMLSGVAAAIAGMTLNWASSPGNLIPPGFGLTRTGGGATYYDSTGTLQTAAADTARGTYIYNGSAWVFDGTMIEAAATNICTYSEDYTDVSWQKYLAQVVVTANQYTAPDGNATMDKLQTTASGSSIYLMFKYITRTAATYTHSEFFRYVNNRWVSLAFLDADAGGSIGGAGFDLLNGVVGTVSAGVTAAITPIGNSTYRCSITRAFTGTSAFSQVRIAINNADATDAVTWAPAGTEAIGIWGADEELGSSPTSYIATGAASATRNADIPTAPTSGLLVNAQGFVAMKYRVIAAPSSQGVQLSTFDGAAGGIPLFAFGGNIKAYDGTTTVVGPANTLTVGTVYNNASTWGGSAIAIGQDGSVVSGLSFDGSMNFGASMRIGAHTDATVPLSMVLQSLRLGVQTVNNSRLANPFA